MQFVDLNLKECEKEIKLLKPLYTKYQEDVEIITIYKKQDRYTKKQETLLKSIPWEKFEIPTDQDILKKYQIETFPSYVLIDAYGYVVAAPALKPTPNGNYETIDKLFFFIQKHHREEK